MRSTLRHDPLAPAAMSQSSRLFQEKTLSRALKRFTFPVNQAYSLTPEAIGLMWKIAPSRMPFSRP